MLPRVDFSLIVHESKDARDEAMVFACTKTGSSRTDHQQIFGAEK